jgi:hypothetical protein
MMADNLLFDWFGGVDLSVDKASNGVGMLDYTV